MTSTRPTTLTSQEDWLRANGLPFVVPGRRRLRRLVPRTSAALIALTFFASGLLIADAAISVDDVIPLFDLVQYPRILAALVAAGVTATLGIPAACWYARWQRRLGLTSRLICGAVVLFLWLIGLSLAAAMTDAHVGLHLPIEHRLGFLLLAMLLAWLELDQIFRWAARRSMHELTAAIPAVARVLPILLLTVLLAFFTGELWQIAATLTKTRMWLLSTFLIALTVIIALPATHDMLDEVDESDLDALLAKTPFEGVEATPSKLSLGERTNLVLVSLSVQAAQTALFVALTFAVFTIFGAITLTPELIAKWTDQPALPLVWFGIQLPMDWATFRVCLILALFSGVSFAASTLMDGTYRALFLDQVATEMRRNVAARHCYRTTLRNADKIPPRWQLLVAPDDD